MTTGATLDLELVRGRFPALAQVGPDGRPVVHADAPGGTQVPEDVITAIAEHLRRRNANDHGAFAASRETGEMCDRVRGQVAGFVGGVADGVVFGPNMTTLTWHVARALARRLEPGDELVCTQLDHDANVAPWLAVAEQAGARVRFVPLDPATGRLRVDALDELVTDRTRLVAFPRASNALGTVVDPEPFVRAARRVGGLTYMDAVHGASHVALRQREVGVDVLACSPYKFYGPHLGVLSADPALLADLTPDRVRAAPDSGPERWQTGTAQFEAIAGTGAALAYIAEIGGIGAIAHHEATLTARFLDGLSELRERGVDVALHGPPGARDRTPTFALTFGERDPAQVVRLLAERGIAAWAGHYYALEPMRALGLLDRGGAVRIGFAHYHGPGDVDRVLDALAAEPDPA